MERIQLTSRDDVLSEFAHDLRTPLTAIRSFSEILVDNPDLLDSERHRFLSVVLEESDGCIGTSSACWISQVKELQKPTRSCFSPRSDLGYCREAANIRTSCGLSGSAIHPSARGDPVRRRAWNSGATCSRTNNGTKYAVPSVGLSLP